MNEDERETARTMTRLVAHNLAKYDGDTSDEDALLRNTREFAVGFAAGVIWYERRGADITPEEVEEIREIVYEESTRLRSAMA